MAQASVANLSANVSKLSLKDKIAFFWCLFGMLYVIYTNPEVSSLCITATLAAFSISELINFLSFKLWNHSFRVQSKHIIFIAYTIILVVGLQSPAFALFDAAETAVQTMVSSFGTGGITPEQVTSVFTFIKFFILIALATAVIIAINQARGGGEVSGLVQLFIIGIFAVFIIDAFSNILLA